MQTQIIKTEKYTIEYSQFTTYENRLASFDVWPADKFPKPEQLARCGFYIGTTIKHVYCFYCGRGKEEWSAYDNPWVEHALLCPTCPFLLLSRSTPASFSWNSSISVAEPPSLFQTVQVSII